jgi:hypothetical protein
MDQNKRKILSKTVKDLSEEWMTTGIRRPNERFFGLLSKKQMSLIIINMMALLVVADLAIFYLLYLTNS